MREIIVSVYPDPASFRPRRASNSDLSYGIFIDVLCKYFVRYFQRTFSGIYTSKLQSSKFVLKVAATAFNSNKSLQNKFELKVCSFNTCGFYLSVPYCFLL